MEKEVLCCLLAEFEHEYHHLAEEDGETLDPTCIGSTYGRGDNPEYVDT